MKIVDTVYLVAYLDPGSSLHREAARLLEEELPRGGARVSTAALIELDLVMKSRGYTWREREEAWLLLAAVIGDAVEPLTPMDMAEAARLQESRGLDYFDSLIAAQCINRGADPATTDREILETVAAARR